MLVNKLGARAKVTIVTGKYKKQQKIYLNLRIATDDCIQPKAVGWPDNLLDNTRKAHTSAVDKFHIELISNLLLINSGS